MHILKAASLMVAGMAVLFFAEVMVWPSYAKIGPETVVAIWLFDSVEDNTVEDSSGNGHNGTVNGFVELEEGKFGETMVFGGGASVTVPDDERLNFGTDSFSVVLWLNFSAAQDWNRLIRERDPTPWGSGNYGWEIQTEGVTIHFSLDDSKGNHRKTNYPNVGDGDWHHAAMIVNRDKQLLISYLDGGNERTVDISSVDSVTGGLPVTIGESFIGSIDDVAIFNGVLSVEDIQTIMSKGLMESLYPSAVCPASKAATTWARVRVR